MTHRHHHAQLRARKEKARRERREDWLAQLKLIGLGTRLLAYAVVFYLLYSFWPDEITNRPLAQWTAFGLLKFGAALVITLALIRALIYPADHEPIKHAWGWFGVILIGIFACVVFYMNHCKGCGF
jgi:hypothetical protein